MNEQIHISTFQSALNRIKESDVDYNELLSRMEGKPYKAADTGLTPKVLADWSRKDLLMSEPEPNKMHRFSLTEFVWVKLVEELRKYNFPLETIRSFRDDLTGHEGDIVEDLWDNDLMFEMLLKLEGGKNPEYIRKFVESPEGKTFTKKFLTPDMLGGNILEVIIVMSLFLKTPMTFLLNYKGEGVLFNPIMLQDGAYEEEQIESLFASSFVSISLTEVLANVLVSSDTEFLNGQLMFLSDQEANVLQALREDQLESVRIKFDKDHSMDLMEISKVQRHEREKRLMEILMRDGYQDITLKTQHGKVVFCRNTRKVKL
jgi:DNA-binding transcriptional MerR regulator